MCPIVFWEWSTLFDVLLISPLVRLVCEGPTATLSLLNYSCGVVRR